MRGVLWPTRRKSSVKMGSWSLLCFVATVLLICNGSHAQRRLIRPTRPGGGSSTPGLEAYRNRWMAYYKTSTSSTTSTTTSTRPRVKIPTRKPGSGGGAGIGVRGVAENNKDNLIINGFECERTYSFFPNRNNPRMYHLCARSRDSWFVYHYFCPHGSVFNDGMRKCMQDQPENNLASEGGNSNFEVFNRRPGHPPKRRVHQSPFSRRPTPPSTIRTTTTWTTTPRTTSTTEQEPAPEPDSDHGTATEILAEGTSSEEAYTEDGKDSIDVNVNFPGHYQVSDEAEEELQQLSRESNEMATDDQVNMIIPESGANGPTTTTSSTPKSKQPKPTKRAPKNAESADESSGDGGGEEESMSFYSSEDSGSDAVGSRRPRMLKKKMYWQEFLKKLF